MNALDSDLGGKEHKFVPIEPAAMDDREFVELDRDDIDALKFMKVDVVALGMLWRMRRGSDLLRDHKSIDLDLAPPRPRIRAPTR